MPSTEKKFSVFFCISETIPTFIPTFLTLLPTSPTFVPTLPTFIQYYRHYFVGISTKKESLGSLNGVSKFSRGLEFRGQSGGQLREMNLGVYEM